MYVIQMSSIISFKLLVASLNLVCDNILVYTYKYLNVWKLLACQPVIKLSSIFSPITSGLHAGQGVKAMSHEEICPCNLQCKFCRKKYCRLQLGCQAYATCFATCNEIIFYARRVFQNVSVALRKVEAASTFSATCNSIFRCETSCKHGVSHEEVFLGTCNATSLRCKENCLV